jgi:hypothetical protein
MHFHLKSLTVGLGLAATLGMATLASGQTLINPHNTAIFNFPNSLPYAGNQGMTSLTRNDPPTPADHLQDVNQWFMFYRTDSGTNQSVGTLQLLFTGTADTNNDGLPDQVTATYGNSPTSPSLLVTVTNTLVGSGSNSNASYQSTVSRSMSVRTHFSTPTDVHLFSLTNLALTQVETPPGSNTYTQDPGTLLAQQIGRNIRVWENNPNGQLITDSRTDTDALNMPSKYEIATDASSISALINKLTTTNGDLANTFGSANGPVITGQTGGPANKASLAYALQYDILGVTSTTYITNETLTVTPEPASLALLAIGGSMMLLRRRRA